MKNQEIIGQCQACNQPLTNPHYCFVSEKDKRIKILRKIAARWAQVAQIESGEVLDPGFNHCLEVIDAEVERTMEKEDGRP